MPDAFEGLRRPYPIRRPDPRFAVQLLRRLELERTMEPEQSEALAIRVAVPAMVHLGVGDADRAARFFGEVLGWETERAEYRGHVRHYVLGELGVRPCITDEPGVPDVQLGFQVEDVAGTARLVEELGGTVVQDLLDDDEGPFVAVRDDQGVGLAFWPRGGQRVEPQGWAPPGGLAYFAIQVPDVERATTFYGRLLGWPFETVGVPQYQHVADHLGGVAMGILGGEPAAGVALHFIVADLDAAAAKVIALGGTAGEPHPTGPMLAVDCRDDQGLPFSVAIPDR
jgi:predicted enzyme related to lactoylglutathione lyase